MEQKSELKVIWATVAVIACQVLGIDVSTISAILGDPNSLVSAVKPDGDSSLVLAGLAAVYTACRAYIKGRK